MDQKSCTAEKSLLLTCDIDDVLTYAGVHNGESIIHDICLKNTSESDINTLILRITGSNELIKPFETGVEQIKPDEEIHLKGLKLSVDAGYIAKLTERSSCRLTVEVFSQNCIPEKSAEAFSENLASSDAEAAASPAGEPVTESAFADAAGTEKRLLASETADITVLAFDQWPGLQYTPELLAAFVMPNHPAVTSLIQLAAGYLGKWTKDPSLAGYQFDDPNRVKNMAAAAYAAM